MHFGYSYALLAISRWTDCQQEHECPRKERAQNAAENLFLGFFLFLLLPAVFAEAADYRFEKINGGKGN